MKFLSLFLFLFVFLANTMIASVWAMPCMMDKDSTTMQSNATMANEMPCHHPKQDQKHEQKNESQDQNCEELCLCLNGMVSQIPVIYIDSMNISVVKSSPISIDIDKVASITILPLFRPPIILS